MAELYLYIFISGYLISYQNSKILIQNIKGIKANIKILM